MLFSCNNFTLWCFIINIFINIVFILSESVLQRTHKSTETLMLLVFIERLSLCIPGWLGTPYVDQVGLETQYIEQVGLDSEICVLSAGTKSWAPHLAILTRLFMEVQGIWTEVLLPAQQALLTKPSLRSPWFMSFFCFFLLQVQATASALEHINSGNAS